MVCLTFSRLKWPLYLYAVLHIVSNFIISLDEYINVKSLPLIILLDNFNTFLKKKFSRTKIKYVDYHNALPFEHSIRQF